MGGVEVERKWLVPVAPDWALEVDADVVEQGYLVIGEGGSSEARVRRRAGRFFLTVKSGHGLVRAEHEIALSSDQFETLWPATEGRRVSKTRRKLDGGGGAVIELDVYAGSLDGLVVAEVEFSDEAASAAFEAPAWFGVEVTDDDAYKNRRLAVDGRP
jgi:adenylate cyclase